MRRILGGLAAAVVAMGVFMTVLPATPAAEAQPVADEVAFVAKLNALRAAKRLPPLSVDRRLTASARTWAQKMARKGDIFHNMNLPNEAPPDWVRVGENVGVALLNGDDMGAVQAIHNAFVASPKHYRNMVGRYNRIGVGVVVADGRVFVAQHFMQSQAAAKPTATTAKAAKQPTKSHWLRARHRWAWGAA